MSIKILTGDSLTVLKTLAPESVQCCVTSPPYWGLRDYGTATWEGGEEGCDHVDLKGSTRGGPLSTITGGQDTTGHKGQYRDTCGKCGARRVDSQIGLETTPEEFVATMVEVFREVRRVLRDDGTLWMNLGDSYAGGSGTVKADAERDANLRRSKEKLGGSAKGIPHANGRHVPGLKPKDLVGIPWRVALALQADGWWLRQDIIWHKPNPMPESVTDRCTKAHEYIFLLTKSAKYYYDAEAVAEEAVQGPHIRDRLSNFKKAGEEPLSRHHKGNPVMVCDGTRNLRSVWTITTKPYSAAHFATFPPKIPERCIKAGCPQGGTVLDPFAGAGTTLLVADRLGRDAIGIELNPEYAEMARRRIYDDLPMFVDVEIIEGFP